MSSVVFVEFDGGDESVVINSKSGSKVYVCGSSSDVVVGADVFGVVSVEVTGGSAVVSSVVVSSSVDCSVVVVPVVVSSKIGLDGVTVVSWGVVIVVVARARDTSEVASIGVVAADVDASVVAVGGAEVASSGVVAADVDASVVVVGGAEVASSGVVAADVDASVFVVGGAVASYVVVVRGASVVVVVVDGVDFVDAMTRISTGPGFFRNLRKFPVSFFVSSDRNSVSCFSSCSVDFNGILSF